MEESTPLFPHLDFLDLIKVLTIGCRLSPPINVLYILLHLLSLREQLVVAFQETSCGVEQRTCRAFVALSLEVAAIREQTLRLTEVAATTLLETNTTKKAEISAPCDL